MLYEVITFPFASPIKTPCFVQSLSQAEKTIDEMTEKGDLMAMLTRFAIILTCFGLLFSFAPSTSSAACSAPAQIVGDAYLPSSIQDAYDHASSTQSEFTLRLAADVYTEDLVLDGGAVVFDGGYDCSFASKSGSTGFFGTLTISSGSA